METQSQSQNVEPQNENHRRQPHQVLQLLQIAQQIKRNLHQAEQWAILD